MNEDDKDYVWFIIWFVSGLVVGILIGVNWNWRVVILPVT